MDLLTIALQNNAAIDVIERLTALQEKLVARRAEEEFHEALNRAQKEIARIAPDLTNPQTDSRYASYSAIDRVVRPIYTREGLSLSFDTDVSPKGNDFVRVLCYVSRAGHTRTYKIDMPADGKGAKGGDVMTKTHATGAADTYGKRYLVKDIFNIAIGEDDDDGNAPTNGEISKHLELVARAGNVDELKARFRDALQVAGDNKTAQLAVIQAKDARKKELGL